MSAQKLLELRRENGPNRSNFNLNPNNLDHGLIILVVGSSPVTLQNPTFLSSLISNSNDTILSSQQSTA
jgi:hypothetical protein